MFLDRVRIHVAAGRGGNGCASFRREKHVPRGGPDGGDGGPGGGVWIVADPQLRDLSAFTRRVHFMAGAGGHGRGSGKNGAAGNDREIRVPLGTQVWAEGVLLADLVRPGQRVLVARGGQGGRGNQRFVSAVRQAPKFAEFGEEGESRWLDLTLKLMADVGLAGLPNAGKSSLLRRVSNAKPKVAAYPFTTVQPLLGVVEVPGEETSFTMADVPGLLEGASSGVGLGHEFLAHLERCHLVLHVVDVTGYYGAGPEESFRTIVHELEAHAPALGRKPQLVVLNKIDAVDPAVRAARVAVFTELVAGLRRRGHPAFSWESAGDVPPLEQMIWPVSAVTGEGLAPLLRWVGSLVAGVRSEEAVAAERPLGGGAPAAEGGPPVGEGGVGHVVYRPAGVELTLFTVREEDGRYVVEGEAVERLVRRFDMENEHAVRYVSDRLERLGVYQALRERGAAPGDEVEIAGHLFEYR